MDDKEVVQPKPRPAGFDPKKPLVINAAEIEGFKDHVGNFVINRPTLREQIRIGVETAKLTENVELAEVYKNFAFMLATLKVISKEVPQRFTFDDCPDLDAVIELWNRYTEWLDFFRGPVQGANAIAG